MLVLLYLCLIGILLLLLGFVVYMYGEGKLDGAISLVSGLLCVSVMYVLMYQLATNPVFKQ